MASGDHHSEYDEGGFRGEPPRPLPAGPLATYPWLTFLLPFAVYMLVQTIEPPKTVDSGQRTVDREGADGGERTEERERDGGAGTDYRGTGGLGLGYRLYPVVYTLKIVATLAAICVVWPGYRTFPFRVSPLAVVVGVVGVVAWIGICRLDLENRWLVPIGLGKLLGLGARSAYNPLAEIENPFWAYAFLAVRFLGLSAVVPLIEEFFLRGWWMRFIGDRDWWKVPLVDATPKGLLFVTVAAMLMHPGELFAAAVWFTLVTWLMLRTGSIWDCVTAHAVTNLLLGIYVVSTGEWGLM